MYDDNRCTIYSLYVCHAIKFAQDLNAHQIALPVPIGPWRCRWWDKYQSGFRVDCEFPEDDALFQ
ncbi:hypothetical protein [Gimesia alba]|uniref:hypothetical protein n=1 Tax=Gimesia alba TaxID=2527973 RepID=UPI0011A22E52|nr:hypothetical protein [Gimesia alba]